MYEDSWYSYVPELPTIRQGSASAQGPGHRRKESLLQQPSGPNAAPVDVSERLENVYEEIENTNTPPEPSVPRRAASYTDFYHVARAQISRDATPKKQKLSKRDRQWEALMLPLDACERRDQEALGPKLLEPTLDEQLLNASQDDYSLYHDQLQLTERHLNGLIDDANVTLQLLTTLSNSFQSVENQTSTFQAQCEDLLNEQKRLEKLADDVGTDLHYYAYLETATRRLNAPGASRMVDDDAFGDMVENIEACIVFMEEHETYRDRDTYLARYNALLTKALHLLDHGFTTRLEKIMSELGRQIAATQSDSARHALAYGRFEEMINDTYSLIPNIHRLFRLVYDQYGRHVDSPRNTTVYADAASNILRTYLTTRDRDLRAMTQHDLEEFRKESKTLSVETAARNYIKQAFERVYDEERLFVKVFNMEPNWSSATNSAFQILATINTSMVHPGHLAPLGHAVQSTLQGSSLQVICGITGWLASEYSIAEIDEEESPFFLKCREYAARLLAHHLWPFTDKAFDAEITKSISKGSAPDSALKIGPVEGGVSSSNAYPLVKRANELLVMFDQSMPKERSSKDSSVVFKIVRETIQVLQRAEARIKSLRNGTDADLFMVKNLLLIKNELVSLEIGDIRGQAGSSMDHFTQIWETLTPQNWVGFFSSVIGGSLWSRAGGGGGGGGAPVVTAKTLTVEDMSEQLDELLRQSIYAFTKRWATLVKDSQARKAGVKPIAKVEAELENVLQTAFSNQPEVISKLKEAIELNAQAQRDAADGKQGAKRY